MKSTTTILSLLSLLSLTSTSLAIALPQFQFPTRSIPSFPIPTSGGGGSTGGGSSSGSDTDNDVTNKASCKTLTVIYARGTSESGNVGTVAGPPFFSALKSDVGAGNVNVQGVDYAASWDGAFSGGDSAGSSTMASLVGQALSQCPSTKIVLSGYSQGAQLVHNAAKQLSSTQTAAVSSAVVFGDPYNGQAIGSIPASKVDSFCASGDTVCDGAGLGGGGITSAHLSYGNDAGAAATFVQKAAGL